MFKQAVNTTFLDRLAVTTRVPEVYAAVANNLFGVTGPVIIYSLGGIATAAAGGAATMATTFNGVAGEVAAVAINGAVGTVWTCPLNVAGVISPALGAQPMTDALLYSDGMICGVGAAADGVIIGTVAVATWTGVIWCIWRRLAPGAEVRVI